MGKKSWKLSGKNLNLNICSTTTLSAEEDHVMRLKGPEQLLSVEIALPSAFSKVKNELSIAKSTHKRNICQHIYTCFPHVCNFLNIYIKK